MSKAGAVTFAVVVTVTALIGYADAQMFTANVKTIKTTVEKNPPPLVVISPATSVHYPSKIDGWTPPGERTVETPKEAPTTAALPSIDRGRAPGAMPDAVEIVIIKYGRGGSLHEHIWRFSSYRNKNSKVEIRGPCYSACTLVTAYVAKTDLCIAQGAFLAFHAVRTRETHEIMPAETGVMYYQQPEPIRDWIDRMGGWQKLPLDGYWTMYDRDLWAMGYPKCQ